MAQKTQPQRKKAQRAKALRHKDLTAKVRKHSPTTACEDRRATNQKELDGGQSIFAEAMTRQES